MKLSKSKLKELKEIESKNGKITVSDFKTILKTNINKDEFKFETKIEYINNKFVITFLGKHYAKNVIQNTWHRGILLKYKKAIKTSAKNAFLLTINKSILPYTPLTKVKVNIKVYNPRSRDDDANYDTLKWMRDTFTVHKLLKDDNRNIIVSTQEEEILSKEWKIVFIVEDISVP